MKTISRCLLILVVVSASAFANSNSATNLRIRIVDLLGSGVITVEIRNASDKPLRIWKESSSWGYGHWRVLVLRKGRLITLFQNPDQGFSKNYPDYDEIAVGSHVEKKLDLNEGNWRGLDLQSKFSFESGDTIIVTYDVPKAFTYREAPDSVEASSMGVWYGVTAATTTAP